MSTIVNAAAAKAFYSTEYESPLGTITLASDGQAICGLWLPGQKHFGGAIANAMTPNPDAGGFAEARSWLDDYFAGEKPAISEIPLAPVGSEFQQVVWQILCEIPYGESTTYGEIAEKVRAIRGKASALAVGGAVGRNPISIIVPCHRVVGSDGNLTGYAGGLDKKIWLLEHEGAEISRFYIPKTGIAL